MSERINFSTAPADAKEAVAFVAIDALNQIVTGLRGQHGLDATLSALITVYVNVCVAEARTDSMRSMLQLVLDNVDQLIAAGRAGGIG